jgi:hypothetical protein
VRVGAKSAFLLLEKCRRLPNYVKAWLSRDPYG